MELNAHKMSFNWLGIFYRNISELPEDRAGASPVSVSVRVSADRQRLLAQADV